ncbi:hypothetical protein C3B44_11240 [Corynebacterium yudongzhengii]|uniref:Uncharacterized protein n=1 Tax=Corynebacterium yudongzhengii TaxID=2080740 RepID=A0A2U1T4E5_9CORY|nr:hypothetical protein [Corynebacterium yudongzhengii]AWB82833.1 hypothetical protein C3B44_11240 [Corynebacterium yudongzhengii]PWC00871.1 hypothetical protein DF222_10490 [Corynebacterium yudongzhengii]
MSAGAIVTIAGIVSIVLGFFCFASAYLSVMKKKPAKLSWIFGIAGALFVTVIPVTLAVFFATTINS